MKYVGVEKTYKVRSIKLKSVHTLTFKRIWNIPFIFMVADRYKFFLLIYLIEKSYFFRATNFYLSQYLHFLFYFFSVKSL